ncbi:MAG: hypothetical protein AB8B69_21190 [Chitinophagales bacterium]
MKQILLTIFLLFTIFQAFAQTTLKSTRIDTNYTWKNSTLIERNHFYLKLPVVEKSQYKTHFRISLTGQIIDFFSEDSISFKGILTNEIIEYKETETKWGKGSEKYQIVYQTQELDESLSTQLAKQIIESGQVAIPTDSLIEGWNDGYLHCKSIDFQFKIDEFYKELSFSCTNNQLDSIRFKSIILSNEELLKNELDLETKYIEFKNLLPKGKTYSKDGYKMLYFIATDGIPEWEKNAPRRAYLKSIKDSLDNYLEKEVSKQGIDLEEMECLEDYYVAFGTDGRLKKVQIPKHEKLDLRKGRGNKKEVKQCRKKIKSIFRKADLGSFNLKYKVYRVISCDAKGEVKIKDYTLYE